MEESDLIEDHAPRRQFLPFHARRERCACIVPTVAPARPLRACRSWSAAQSVATT
jgi:hypothetical protein